MSPGEHSKRTPQAVSYAPVRKSPSKAWQRSVLALLFGLLATGTLQAEPAHVILIRHGEKAPSLPDDKAGSHLSLAGYFRAAALVAYLQKSPDLTKLGKISFVFAQMPRKEGDSVRPIQTVEPFARASGLKVLTPVARDDYQTLVDTLLKEEQYDGKIVLICWEHEKLAELATAMVKGKTGSPRKLKWPGGHAFDRTWVLSFDKASNAVEFHDYPQRMMLGDSEK